MKAKTIRPLLILLLFGFFPTSGWMIVRGGADTTRVITTACPIPGGAAAHRHAARPWPGIPAAPAAPQRTAPAGVYAQPSASNTPSAGSALPHGASGGPTSPAVAAAPLDNPPTGAGDYAYDPGDGFGDFGVPGALPGGASDSGYAGGTGSDGTSVSSHSGSGTGGGGAGGGSSGSSGGGSGVGLLDPPGGSGGLSPGGQDSISGSGNHENTVPEPSTLALFLAGAAALGFVLRRRRHPGD